MEFYHPEDNEKELAFDDLFFFQQYTDFGSRKEVNMVPNSPLSTTIPIISSNMNSVTGKRMAEKLARFGGLGVLPQDMSLEKMLEVIKYVHNSDVRLDTPLTLSEKNTINDALGIINKRSHQSIVMVSKKNKPITVFKEEDFNGYDKQTKLKNVNKGRPLVVGKKGKSNEEYFNIMEDNGINSLPIVNKKGVLIGILTKKDSLNNKIYTPALNSNGQLDLAVALSVNGYRDNIGKIIKAGVNTIFLDTAHGYTKNMAKVIENIKKKYNNIILIAGNVMAGDGTQHLIDAGADGVKIGIGPGGMCTTRIKTGVGRPQFSAVLESAKIANENGKFVIADGGIKNPRDLNLAIAAGATHGMFGTLLAGTFESPGDTQEDMNGKYKENWGMASQRAVNGRTTEISKFNQAIAERFKEGVSNAKVYGIKPLGDIIEEYTTGLASSISYAGVKNIKDFQEKALVGVQTSAGFIEGTPHGK